MTLSLRYVARSDVGLIRDGNEDSGYAGPSLLAVADGMGGHAAGEVASSVALATLATLEDDVPSTELLDALATAVGQANDAINDMVEKHPQLDGMGTTLTAMLWSGRRLGLVHVGDSRAYLLRDGVLLQITHDHTFVQQLQDEGRITAAEAAVHPQRSLLLRALDGRSNPEPDLSVREVHLGDRYLLCSDGLSGVVPDPELQGAMTGTTLDEAADTLIQLALRGGGPDNITCIVADVVEVDANTSDQPIVVGAAAGRHKPASMGSTNEIDLSALPDLEKANGSGRWFGTLWVRFLIAGIVIALIAGGWAGYAWSQRQYYVGADTGRVAIYKGLSQKIIGLSLSDTYEHQDIELGDLPPYDRQEVEDTIFADSLGDAHKVVDRLRALATACQDARATAAAEEKKAEEKKAEATASPKPTSGAGSGADEPTPSPTATASASADPSGAPSPQAPIPPEIGEPVTNACGEALAPGPTPDVTPTADPTQSPSATATTTEGATAG
ncbi:protein phosphatase 2C domain-containing protein [Sporichthya sp.]|uniref:PP2C family protein-serine/threonine phosphatase n=1 Tax=Sporichthya sp. TaxID=65475 RepID=UPI0017AA430F|nr:protein phosphatase 2C domain-containing protein [Sporichthya sp.]MBA3743939.1 protein phosphatase 2C domain-containing protein [Sporichthya sp.]